MHLFDSKTLIFTICLVDLALTVILVYFWHSNRVYPGFNHWTFGSIAKTAGFALLLVSLVSHATQFLLAANILIIMSMALCEEGLRRFADHDEGHPYWYYLFYGVVLAAYVFFLFIRYDTGARIVIISLCIAVQMFRMGQLLRLNLDKDYGSDRIMMFSIYYITAVMLLVRAGLTLAVPGNPQQGLDSYPNQNWIQPLWISVSMVTTILFLNCNVKRLSLEHAVSQSRLKILEGLLPICCYCKKIKDSDNNSWLQMETYITRNSEAVFSHVICPVCFDREITKLEVPVQQTKSL